SQCEDASTWFEARTQLGERQPGGCRARGTQTLRGDEYALALDAEKRTQNFRHTPVGLVGNDVVNCRDISPEHACSRGSVIEQFWSVVAHRSEIVFELECPAVNDGLVRAAGVECEARRTAETDLAKEVARNTSAGSGIVGT